DVAVAIGRLHRVAGNLQRVGVLVSDGGESDLLPALADREAAIVEITAGTRFGEADQRHVRDHCFAAVGEQAHESVDLGIGRGQPFWQGPRASAWRAPPSDRAQSRSGYGSTWSRWPQKRFEGECLTI